MTTKFDKYTIVNFIYKAKMYKLKCVYIDMLYNKIPVYESKDITSTLLVETNEQIFIIVKDCSEIGEQFTHMDILSMLICKTYRNSNMAMDIADLCLANWFGFNKTIDYINNISDIDDNTRKIRIGHLNKVIEHNISCSSIKVPSLESIINGFKYIEVN